MNWDETVKRVKPYLLRIETQTGAGTGFLCVYNEDKAWCGIATAAHVVDDAERWNQPIRLSVEGEPESIMFKEEQRIIFIDRQTDSAVVMCPTEKLKLPKDLIPLSPAETKLPIGTELGWLGYPAIESGQACFFSGVVSARRDHRNAYLIDGVAINGVSGGPVFHCTPSHGVQIIGTVSAYIANRATGETLPGLLVAQDVSHFHDVAKHIQDVDQAMKRKQEFDHANDAKPEANTES